MTADAKILESIRNPAAAAPRQEGRAVVALEVMVAAETAEQAASASTLTMMVLCTCGETSQDWSLGKCTWGDLFANIPRNACKLVLDCCKMVPFLLLIPFAFC